jgi:hypothetical protein
MGRHGGALRTCRGVYTRRSRLPGGKPSWESAPPKIKEHEAGKILARKNRSYDDPLNQRRFRAGNPSEVTSPD